MLILPQWVLQLAISCPTSPACNSCSSTTAPTATINTTLLLANFSIHPTAEIFITDSDELMIMNFLWSPFSKLSNLLISCQVYAIPTAWNYMELGKHPPGYIDLAWHRNLCSTNDPQNLEYYLLSGEEDSPCLIFYHLTPWLEQYALLFRHDSAPF